MKQESIFDEALREALAEISEVEKEILEEYPNRAEEQKRKLAKKMKRWINQNNNKPAWWSE